MRYVHLRWNVATSFSGQTGDARLRRRSAGARIASATGWTDEKVQALQEEISLRYISPLTVPVGQAAQAGGVAGAALHLLNVGFSLSLPERCSLTWARFVVEGAEDAPPARFGSLFPHAVYRETVFAGPIVVDDDGMLTRETSESAVAANEGLVSPLVIGFVSATRSACWDFTPLDGRPPAASDRLVLAISKRPEHVFVPRQQLFVNVFDPDLGEALLELPGSTSS